MLYKRNKTKKYFMPVSEIFTDGVDQREKEALNLAYTHSELLRKISQPGKASGSSIRNAGVTLDSSLMYLPEHMHTLIKHYLKENINDFEKNSNLSDYQKLVTNLFALGAHLEKGDPKKIYQLPEGF
ncbi:hypothetical protein IPJ91_01355 [bacterium]|nr:MAG: hypothetical protein IPJ91_01355 [bacterium]